jgi:hypothetical protein
MQSHFHTMAKGLLPILIVATLAAATGTDPCGQISSLYTQDSETTTFSPSLVLDCLMSMPFDTNAAMTWIDEYSKYMEFQSDLEILAKPPLSYLSPRVDLLAGLQAIKSHASQGVYKSQYEFDSDVFDLIRSANVGHLYIQPCSLTAFTFLATIDGVVSVSVDGVTTPQLYTLGKLIVPFILIFLINPSR